MTDLTPTSILQIAPDNGNSFVLGVAQPQSLSFTIPKSGSANGTWQSGVVTAIMDGNYTVVFNSYSGSSFSPPFPVLAPPSGINPPTTAAGYGTFYYPLGGQSFGQTDTYSNVLLTLTPWPLPTPSPVNAGTIKGVRNTSEDLYICPGKSAALSWFDTDTASYTITDDAGNTFSGVQEPGDSIPFVIGPTVSPTKPTTVYTFAATGFGGDTVTSTITVHIIPFSATISVDTTNIVAGQPVHLVWSSAYASCVQFSGQIMPAGQPLGPVIAMDARGGYLEPAIAEGGLGWPNFFGYPSIGGYPNGWNYPADAYPSGTLTIYPQVTMTLFCTATSSGSCGTVKSNSVQITVSYPTDAGSAAGTITAGGLDKAKGPTGGGGGTTTTAVPRRSTLSAPGSRFCRAEDVSGGGISFRRANGPVPMLRDGTLWEASSSVTGNIKDSGPALFLDQRGLLYCAFSRVTPPTVPPAAAADTSKDGVYLRRSDDYGTTWPAHLDASGTTEIMAIPAGTLPAAASGNGSTLVAAIIGSDKAGYKIETCYKSAGGLIFSTPVVAVDSTGTALAVQNSGIALCRAAEGPGRWILSTLIKGDTATSDWWSADAGASWTRIATS